MQPEQPAPNYNFIFDSPKPVKRSPLKFGNGGPLARIVVVLFGLIVLLILFSVLKGIFSGNTSGATYLNQVYANQQELIHLATNAGQAQTISDDNKNFALTTQLSLTSEQSQLATYLKQNHIKINTKLATASLSAMTDTTLSNAQSAGTYDQTFAQVMASELSDYQRSLKAAYAITTGPKGRALLSADYTGASLLAKQLTSPQS